MFISVKALFSLYYELSYFYAIYYCELIRLSLHPHKVPFNQKKVCRKKLEATSRCGAQSFTALNTNTRKTGHYLSHLNPSKHYFHINKEK
jgi:hypothetical protein